jgi:hypothetical protein
LSVAKNSATTDLNAQQFAKVKDNRIKQWRDQEYRYDPWGNLIEKRCGHSKLQIFSYDCENRLVRAETVVDGKLESRSEYRYDSLGRRVAKQAEINGEVEQKRFLWQGLRMLREETPGQSILYLYEPGTGAGIGQLIGSLSFAWVVLYLGAVLVPKVGKLSMRDMSLSLRD